MKQAHILNGDALKERFPTSISGQIIVARECLIEGDTSGDTLEEFYESRSMFLSNAYPDDSDYFTKVVPEFESILGLSKKTIVYLWFEDDLFCQANFWFVCSLMSQKKAMNISLVRPENNLQYGFGGLSEDNLIQAFENATPLAQIDLEYFAQLWSAYKDCDSDKLRVLGNSISKKFEFILGAIEAAIGIVEDDEPRKLIEEIIAGLDEPSFPNTFREFYKRHPIYGFGDLQVKRRFEEIISTD